MFDLGESDFAFEIAKRALDMWKAETDFSYNTYECFGIKTQRGGWFHNFGGLSAPICVWTNAYYKPGTVTSGFDLWTDKQETTENTADIAFKYFGSAPAYTILVCLSDKNTYTALLNGKELDIKEREPGIIEITLSGNVKEGEILIAPRA